jgi:hypothetical protein
LQFNELGLELISDNKKKVLDGVTGAFECMCAFPLLDRRGA